MAYEFLCTSLKVCTEFGIQWLRMCCKLFELMGDLRKKIGTFVEKLELILDKNTYGDYALV